MEDLHGLEKELQVLRLDVDTYDQWRYWYFRGNEPHTASCTVFNTQPQVRFAW